MIKKLCFFLSTVIFAGTLTPVMAAEKEPTITDSYKTEILMDLGMINKDAYSGNTISRMDFLKSICAAISENVPDGKDLINMGKEYDITVAEGISDFKGNAAVTYDEAIKMTISACGYDSAAQFSGGFPKGYRDMATRLDIGVKGINPSETITPDIAIEILFDMIQAPSLTLSGVQNNSGIYDEGETILKKRERHPGERLVEDSIIKRTAEVARPIFFSTLIIITAYLPLFAFEHIERKLFTK